MNKLNVHSTFACPIDIIIMSISRFVSNRWMSMMLIWHTYIYHLHQTNFNEYLFPCLLFDYCQKKRVWMISTKNKNNKNNKK
jgi:hypothetical protein